MVKMYFSWYCFGVNLTNIVNISCSEPTISNNVIMHSSCVCGYTITLPAINEVHRNICGTNISIVDIQKTAIRALFCELDIWYKLHLGTPDIPRVVIKITLPSYHYITAMFISQSNRPSFSLFKITQYTCICNVNTCVLILPMLVHVFLSFFFSVELYLPICKPVDLHYWY